MRQIIKKIVINLLSLLVIVNIIGGINYQNNIVNLFFASICLLLLNIIVKPLLNLLFMPINLITLGASKWLINIIIFYGVTIFIDSFKIIPINLPSVSLYSYSIPAIDLSFIWSLVLVSLAVQLLVSIISWILK